MPSSITFKFYSPSQRTFKHHKTKTSTAKETPGSMNIVEDITIPSQTTNSASKGRDINVDHRFILSQFKVDQ